MASGEGPRLPGRRLPPPKGAPPTIGRTAEQTLFRSTDFMATSPSSQPLIKSDSGYTYFAGDIAYHKTKIDRGFQNAGGYV